MLIEVTDDDIANGKPMQEGFCPVALAMRRIGLEDVHVGGHGVGFRVPGRERVIKFLMPSVRNFIKRFDEYECGLEPFSFELDED